MKARLAAVVLVVGAGMSAALALFAVWLFIQSPALLIVGLLLMLVLPIAISLSLPDGARAALRSRTAAAISFQPGAPAAPGFFWKAWRRA